jgi:hypothetical protein
MPIKRAESQCGMRWFPGAMRTPHSKSAWRVIFWYANFLRLIVCDTVRHSSRFTCYPADASIPPAFFLTLTDVHTHTHFSDERFSPSLTWIFVLVFPPLKLTVEISIVRCIVVTTCDDLFRALDRNVLTFMQVHVQHIFPHDLDLYLIACIQANTFVAFFLLHARRTFATFSRSHQLKYWHRFMKPYMHMSNCVSFSSFAGPCAGDPPHALSDLLFYILSCRRILRLVASKVTRLHFAL